MAFNEDFNKNYFSNVPYLDGADKTLYESDIDGILNNDISSSSVYNNVKNLNSAFADYLDNRTSSAIGNGNALDQQLLLAYKSNNEMIQQLTQSKIEKYKKLNNIKTHIDTNTPGNNELVTKILEGDIPTDKEGVIDITKDKISELQNEINEKERNLEINTYYEKKYAKQYKVIRNVVILLSIILAISALFKSGILGEKTFISIIGILLAFSVIYISYEVYDIFMRDNSDFDQYKYYTRSNRPYVGLSEKEKGINIPLELKADIPGFCKLKDEFLNI